MVETTYLSRIIKSRSQQPDDTAGISPLTFEPLGGGARKASPQGEGRFVPMGLYEPPQAASPAQEPDASADEGPNEPPTVTVTEEEMNIRLREAFDKGLTEGKNLAERGLLNVFRSLRTATEGVNALRERVLRESEDELIDLIMMVARKVILREVTQDRRILSSVLEAGIAAISERDEITIRLNPDDYILITSSHEDFFRKELITDRMYLKSDPSILPGFCQIDSEMGMIDASVDAQLEQIYRHLLEWRNTSQTPEA